MAICIPIYANPTNSIKWRQNNPSYWKRTKDKTALQDGIARIRQIPESFSWVDHRLVRNRYIESCTHEQSALYLFLVCVADALGLRHYSHKSIMKKLDMDLQSLKQARSLVGDQTVSAGTDYGHINLSGHGLFHCEFQYRIFKNGTAFVMS